MTRIVRTALAAAIGITLLLPAADAARRGKRPPAQSERNTQVLVVTGHRIKPPTINEVRAVWTQYGPSGLLEARVVVEGKFCPRIVIDLKQELMEPRAAADEKFLTICSATIRSGTKQAALAFSKFNVPLPEPEAGEAAIREWSEKELGVPPPGPDADEVEWMAWRDAIESHTKYDLIPLPLPVADPQRILVLGDTGCRIKGKELQACDEPESWPFPRIAAEAAKLRPDLVIHVGDYLYRENACPADFKGCTGTPWGDNWPTWDADFFAPAKPLLAAAPWVIVRGNHEDCHRAGPGFLRLLGPSSYDPSVPCVDHLPLYDVPLAHMTLAVTDNANAPDTSVNPAAIPALRQEIAGLANEKAPVWWLMHRPIWAPITGPLGIPAGGNLTMMQAVPPTGIPKPVELMLAGHIHTFQIINYADEPHVPPQVVAGFGGDKLEPTPANLRGTIFQGDSGVEVHDGLSVGGFGFLLMTRTENDWRLDVYDTHGRIERVCWLRDDRLACPVPRR